MKYAASLFLLGFVGLSIPAQAQPVLPLETELRLLGEHVFYVSEVMLHDVTSPPAASRVYAYAALAAYEAGLRANGAEPVLGQRMRAGLRLRPVHVPRQASASFCSNYAMMETAQALMPSGYRLEEKKQALVDYYLQHGYSSREINQQVKFASEIARQVIALARTDGYGRLSTFARYTPKKGEGYWYPTPPAYMGAVEPHWHSLRTFWLDAPTQFAPPPPAPFSLDSTSSFYAQMMEVYHTGRNLTQAQREIASFWDCNPFAVSFSGHMAIGLKKISPGGHWMAIAGIACRKARLSLASALLVHALVGTTLHDAFVSCWQEKYHSHRIRPETVINRHVDAAWRPILQTPPFPEYSSGHSVISSASATVLTHLLGDNFAFTDDSEVYFGLPERSFTSFRQAAEEAAISRLYGGIHFRDACELGVVQGARVGEFVLERALGVVRDE